jgi:protocatechuate 3,4-dioxygenase beta subunit
LTVEGPQDVKPDELAGFVVDEKGKPLAGVKVHLWDWVDSPENYTFTGADGRFRIPAGKERQVQVRYRKDGYSPVMATRQAVGVKGLVIAMDRTTYFEGVVRGPDGKPAAGAIVRADQGPKMLDGCVCTHIWTQTTADADGRYRLYVEPDEYSFHVKAPGVGVARLPKTGIAHGQGRTYDVALQPGITFKARVVDSLTSKPVAGLRLHDWEQKDVDGTSDAAGEVTIKDLLPGEFTFTVKAEGYARWWSEQATREWERKAIDDPKTGWQRNFDGLTFDLKPGLAAVTVVAEPAVRVTGRVLDPDGKPVAGATVAPARTGSGNSLTGDTRLSVKTTAEGTFVMTLPASGAAEYNLVAHDGGCQEWRTWANGVLPPVRTTPGQKIDGVELRLTRPAVVRGKVVDAAGRPVAGRDVRAHSADGLENRYYDPTTTTKGDGTFELRFVRPAEQMVQAAPFWLRGADAPAGTSRTLILKPGQVVGEIILVAAEEWAK